MNLFARSSEFNVEEFLRDYWQQKPILIRNFFSHFEEPLDGAELAGIALEEGVESRLVEFSPPDSYQLEHGPFSEARFLATAPEDWTLLVQAVDELLPEVASLKHAFDFLPSWRIDDIMISYAVPGGSVGPHIDFYDVFLIQGAGSRTWRLGDSGAANHVTVTDSGLKLLQQFETVQELTVESGDVLYIPPGVPHWGIARSAGLCYSVGFRAPASADMIESLSDVLIDASGPEDRFRDGSLTATHAPGEISRVDMQKTWQSLKPKLNNETAFLHGFGELVSQPRYPERIIPMKLEEASAELNRGMLIRSPSARFAWMRPSLSNDENLWLFVNGEMFEQPVENLQAVIGLCDLTIDNVSEIPAAENEAEWQNLLLQLFCQGSVFADIGDD